MRAETAAAIGLDVDGKRAMPRSDKGEKRKTAFDRRIEGRPIRHTMGPELSPRGYPKFL
jgi:hypothetical protein